MMNSNGRVVLITGCSTGIGRETALYLGARGWQVFASARHLDAIRDLQAEHVAILPLDVTDEAARIQAISEVVQQAGRLDALVNNAGVNIGGPLELVSLQDAREQFETNVWSALRLIQLAVPVMREQGGGRIVNITSVLGRLSLPFAGLYCSSKFALEALSDTLRWELTPWNIQVSVVEPGAVASHISSKARTFRSRFADDPHYGRYLQGARADLTAVQPPKPMSAVRQVIKQALAGKHPRGVARVIERALTDRHPRPRYEAGLDTHLYLRLRSLIPDRLYDYGVRRIYHFQTNLPEGTSTLDSKAVNHDPLHDRREQSGVS